MSKFDEETNREDEYTTIVVRGRPRVSMNSNFQSCPVIGVAYGDLMQDLETLETMYFDVVSKKGK